MKSKMAFKVGDKFKVVENLYPNKNIEGNIGTVTYVDSDEMHYKVQWNNGGISENWRDEGDMQLITTNTSISMEKFYRAKKDMPAITAGGIVRKNGSSYETINDLFLTDAVEGDRCTFNAYTVENAPEWWERVYEVNLLSKTVYKLKEQAKEFFAKEHSE